MDYELRSGSEPVTGYTLINRLGKGGFGEVWKATGPGGFQVALKFVVLDGRVGTAELRALEVIKSIRHPHLLANFGSWQKDSRLIIAMELAEKTLYDRLNECLDQGMIGIPAPEVFEYFLETAKGLDFLNEPRHPTGEGGAQGIQHRDIKPQNLLLVGGSVKVADFGLARVLEHSTTGHTGSLTASYAAPEFFENKTTKQSDQYSLAVAYCQLRGGRLPFVGHAAAVVSGHLHREPDLSMLPEGERRAVARALAKPSRERWPSCRAFVQAVMAVEGVEIPDTVAPADSSWRLPTHPDTASSGPPAKPAPLSELAPVPQYTRKQSAYKLEVWALVAAVLLIATIFLFARNKQEVAVRSEALNHGRPDSKIQGPVKRPGDVVIQSAPAIKSRTPSAEPTKPSAQLSLTKKPPGLPPRSVSESEFVPLFNGKNLSGWRLLQNPDHLWKVAEGGVLEGSGESTPGSRLVTERSDFSNFHLRVETKISEGPNSLIIFYSTDMDKFEESTKYQVRIGGTDSEEKDTGTLFITKPGSPPVTLAKPDPAIPIRPGEWFVEEVIADGNDVTVIVNGIAVTKFRLFSRKLTSVSIGLGCRPNSKVAFRKVEIKKLIVEGAGGSTEGGESKNASQPPDVNRVAALWGDGTWQIEGDQLVQTQENKLCGLSFGDSSWTDYSFSADVKVLQRPPAATFFQFRVQEAGNYWFGSGSAGSSICYQASVPPGFRVLTRDSGASQLQNGRWQTMRVDANRNKLTTYLNGNLVNSTLDATLTRGNVGFRLEYPCRFRNIRVTSPNGKILWEGPPLLSMASLYGVLLKGANSSYPAGRTVP